MKVYLDHAATTALDERVLQAMLPYMTEKYGNASSLHSFGREALSAVDKSRETIASLLTCSAKEIYFTSGGTESDNWALECISSSFRKKGKHIVTTKLEHPAILSVCKKLEKEGYSITYVGADKSGVVKTEDIIAAVRADTVLVSVMYVNNEIGTIQPIGEIGRFCRENNIVFHTDAVQAMGSIKIDVKANNIDLLSFSSHKFHGPKGVGVLYVRSRIGIDGFILGGAQERGKRAGTSNTPAIVGTAEALRLAISEMDNNNEKIRAMRDHFVERVEKEIPDCELNGDREKRVVSNADFCFDFVDAEAVLLSLDRQGIAVSSGSACSSGSIEPSHVLLAIGKSEKQARSSVRFTFGKDNTMEEVDYTVDILKETIKKMRDWSPLFHAESSEKFYI